MKGYSIKYALTVGIQEVEVEELKEGAPGKYRYTTARPTRQFETGINFFVSVDGAEEAAKLMAKRKVISLRKSLAKMQPLTKKPKWGKPI